MTTSRELDAGLIAKTVERRRGVRYIGPIVGCYTLSDRSRLDGKNVEVFACRTQSVSAVAAAITAPVIGSVGQLLTARFDDLGIVRGVIDRHIPDGFVFQIIASERQQMKLAARIEWLKRRSARVQTDKRAFRRTMPHDPRSALVLPDGSAVKCFVINLSRSGAAVSAKVLPPIGTKLVLGTLACEVVRWLDVGFAVRYSAVQDAEGLEQLVCGYEPGTGASVPIGRELVPEVDIAATQPAVA